MAKSKEVIGYFPNWGVYSSAHQSMTVDMIPWTKVTMVYHAFFEVGPDWKLKSTDDWADFQKPFPHSEPGWDSNVLKGHVGEYKYYKTVYPNKKIVISIGGYTKSAAFPGMAADPQKRAIFVQSCIDFLKQYPFFDGFDIDWEFPQNRDRTTFPLLLQDMRAAYNANNMSSKILTIAAPLGAQNIINQDVANYISYLDYVNIMSYDVYGAWGNITNHQSPIYNNPLNPEATGDKFNIDYAVGAYLGLGVPKAKLCIGTPYYTRGWKNVDFASALGPNGLFANASGAPVGTWDEPYDPGGQWPWFQATAFELIPGWEKYYDNVAKATYLVNRTLKQFLTYDDSVSLTAKINYILSNNLAGIIIWELSGDNLTNGAAPMTTLLWDQLVALQGGETADTAPDKATGTVDKPVSLDGSYTVTFTIGSQNSATSYELYENSVKIKIGSLSANQSMTQTVTYTASGKAPGSYNYYLILKNASYVSQSSPVVVTVQAVAPPTLLPSPPTVQLDKPSNAGTYELDVLMPPNNNATGLKILENSVVIKDEPVTNKTTQQIYVLPFTNKPTGSYIYIAKLYNANGESPSPSVTASVNNPTQPGSPNLPTTPAVTHNNWQNMPNYSVFSNMWWGVNATAVSLYENDILVNTKNLVDHSPSAQSVEWPLTSRPNGTYYYHVVAENINGKVVTDKIVVSVSNGSGGSIPSPLKPEITTDSISNAGTYKVFGRFPANSSASGYSLYENNVSIATGLLTPNKTTDDSITIKSFTNKVQGVYVYRIDVTNNTLVTSSNNLSITVTTSTQPPVVADASMSFVITSDWGSGANFSITIYNNSAITITTWALEFDFDKVISNVWDTIMTVSGNHYTFKNPSWGGPIPANGNYSFGGGCEGNVGTLKPRNIKLNGKNVILV